MPLNDFRIMESIGKGSFASVYKVVRKSDNKVYAMKRVKINKMSKKEISDALNEIRFLSSIRQKNIVGFLEAFLENNETELCIVMEYCGCGDLASKVERYKRRKAYIDEDVIWRYLIQCIKALSHLHEKGICHRDLKTANTFLTEDGSIKVGDMNVSKRLKKGQLQTQIGTPYYMSPEIWQNRPYDSSSDIWALGCMIYELCSLRPPFLGNSFPELKRAISTGRYTPLPRKYTEALHNVVRAMLKLNPRERPSADEMLRSPDVIRKLHLDGGSAPIAADQPSFPSMMETIKVPQNLKKLGSALPKPCYPDVRPNSPGAWIVSEQEKISDEPVPVQRPARAAPPPPPTLMEKENNGMANYGKIAAVVKEDKQAVERRLQALREGAVNRPSDLFSIAENGGAAAIVGPPGQPQYVRPTPPSAAVVAPSSAAYMPHYEGVGGANGAYQRGRYKPANLVPPPASHRIW